MSAELTHDEKAQISHRAKALKVLLEKLKLKNSQTVA
jgi:inosine/xanthosine triphosphate pyrophosphatase family protein